jgi:hypothetical protein
MREKLILGLLAASIVINMHSLTRLGRLEEQIYSQANHLSSQIGGVLSRVSSIEESLLQLQEGAKWVMAGEFRPDTENSTPTEIHLNYEWSFREVEQGARVYLLYRTETGDWTKIEAANIGGSTYSAHLVLSPWEQYQYQVVAEGGGLQAGEVSNIPERYYRPIAPLPKISTSVVNNVLKDIEVSIHQRELPVFDFFRIRKARVKVYRGEWKESGVVEPQELLRVVELQPLGSDAGRPVPEKGWSGSVELDGSGELLLYLEVEYGDGTIQEGEIWPEDRFEDVNYWKL